MTSKIAPISEESLSIAWAKAFLRTRRSSGREVHHLIVTVGSAEGVADWEHLKIRGMLDAILAESKKVSPATVANTIFPQSLWNPKAPRAALYQRYMQGAFPRLKHCPANRKGTYFQRMVAYDNGAGDPVNQLEHVITTWSNGTHRHSALQLSLFDPRKDHIKTPYLGFPCLQQVSFTAHGSNGADGLSITGFYATQHILTKAYGNYLGLSRLGAFVAQELKLKYIGMTCIASLAQTGSEQEIKSASVNKLEMQVADYLAEIGVKAED